MNASDIARQIATMRNVIEMVDGVWFDAEVAALFDVVDTLLEIGQKTHPEIDWTLSGWTVCRHDPDRDMEDLT